MANERRAPAGPEQFSFALRAMSDSVRRDSAPHRWIVHNAPASFALEPLNGRLPGGWVLIESRLLRQYTAASARLVARRRLASNTAEYIDLPVLPGGLIHEIVELPEDVAELVWQPMDQPGWFEQPHLTIRELGRFERTWRMANRALRALADYPAVERRRYGVTWRNVLFDLPRAYAGATRFRFGSYSGRYGNWIGRFDTLSERDRHLIGAHIGRLARLPHFHLLVAAGSAADAASRLERTLESLRRQLYRNFTVTVFDEANVLGGPLDPPRDLPDVGIGSQVVFTYGMPGFLTAFDDSLASHGDTQWLGLLRAGECLAEQALYRIAVAADEDAAAAVIYGDDDVIDGHGRRDSPRFKPDWSPEHLRSIDYIGNAVLLRGDAVAAAGGVSADCLRYGAYDLLLRASAVVDRPPVHVPAVLLHRPAGADADDGPGRQAFEQRAVVAQCRRGRESVTVVEHSPGMRRLAYGLPELAPMVSIVIPTRNAPDLVRVCVTSIRERSSYRNFEIIVVDNQSDDAAALDYFAALAESGAARVLRYTWPFNFSAINNFAVGEARGEAICLLNNDTEVISPDWMETLLGHLVQPGVGAVGAKLLFPDGRVQHAGDAVGPGGCADHLHEALERDDPGYCNRAIVAQEVSAVTAACLMTWKHLYQRLDGLNAKHLKVAFNDVDFCLRVQEAGYRVIFTPHAELYHNESATRGQDRTWRKMRRTKREADYMRARWKARMGHDPYYNPNLSYRRPDFSLSDAPRVRKPWLDGERKRR